MKREATSISKVDSGLRRRSGILKASTAGAEQRCVEQGVFHPGIHRPALVWIGWLRLLRDARLDGDAGGSGA